MIKVAPISNEDGEVIKWVCKGNGNDISIGNRDATESSCSLLKKQAWVVKKTTNLVFELNNVCPVSSWLNWAVGPLGAILPCILPHLNPIPVVCAKYIT